MLRWAFFATWAAIALGLLGNVWVGYLLVRRLRRDKDERDVMYQLLGQWNDQAIKRVMNHSETTEPRGHDGPD